MPTELPILRIHDTDFYVDLRGSQFIQVDNPENCISFADVQNDDTHCTVIYDTKTKNAFQGTWGDFTASATAVEVRLPSVMELDPPTLSAMILENSQDDKLAQAARYAAKLNAERKKNNRKLKRK